MVSIGGLQKFSAVDYPGKLAAVIFLNGCNYKCPWCHNSALLNNEYSELLTDIVSFLKSRVGLLDGVVITGGEPTIYPKLSEFIRLIRSIGLLIKLDTNGSNPKEIQKIISEGLIDYIAMDIKAPPQKYSQVCGVNVDIKAIGDSIKIILNSKVPFEFRMTLVPQIESTDAEDIASLIGNRGKLILQRYRYVEGGPLQHKKVLSQKDEFAKKLMEYGVDVSFRGF
jgi:pyruvate formate lyase activating enzyme